MYRNRIRSGALLALCATVCGTVFLNFGGRPPSSESSPSRGVPQLGPHLQDVPGTRASTEQVSWKRLSCAWLVGNGMRPDMLKLYTFCPRIVIHTTIYEIYWLFPPFCCFHCYQILTQATMQGQQWWFSIMVTSGLFSLFFTNLCLLYLCAYVSLLLIITEGGRSGHCWFYAMFIFISIGFCIYIYFQCSSFIKNIYMKTCPFVESFWPIYIPIYIYIPGHVFVG